MPTALTSAPTVLWLTHTCLLALHRHSMCTHTSGPLHLLHLLFLQQPFSCVLCPFSGFFFFCPFSFLCLLGPLLCISLQASLVHTSSITFHCFIFLHENITARHTMYFLAYIFIAYFSSKKYINGDIFSLFTVIPLTSRTLLIGQLT